MKDLEFEGERFSVRLVDDIYQIFYKNVKCFEFKSDDHLWINNIFERRIIDRCIRLASQIMDGSIVLNQGLTE